MRVVKAADGAWIPWKNGGGVMRDIAISPPDAGFDDFAWRVSQARVERAGPFSSFPGIDRTLSILDGPGLYSTFDGAPLRPLVRGSAPYTFPGEVAVEARLIGGAVLDLNVMSRRDRCRHFVAPLAFDGRIALRRLGDALVLYVAAGRVEWAGGEALVAGDAVVADADDPAAIDLSTARQAEIFAAHFWTIEKI